MFFLFLILGALLIVNMLIAMMGNTYLMVAETKKEWTRQVACSSLKTLKLYVYFSQGYTVIKTKKNMFWCCKNAFFFSQWARIVLTTERMLTPAQRLAAQKKYSQPYSQSLGSDGERALIMRLRNHENRQQVWSVFYIHQKLFIVLKDQRKSVKKKPVLRF